MTSHCSVHPDRPARWGCPRCNKLFCGACTDHHVFARGRLNTCVDCGGALQTFTPRIEGHDDSPFGMLARAVTWPFIGEANAVLFGTALVLGVFAAFTGFLGQALIAVFVLGYAEMVVSHTINERPGVPAWPDIQSWFDVLPPLVRLVVVLSVSIAPGFLAAELGAPVWAVSLATMGGLGLYAPMAWLLVLATGSLHAILPNYVIPAIGRVGWDYAVTVPALPVVYFAFSLLQVSATAGMGRILGVIVGAALSVAAGMAASRLLGLVYVRHRDEFEE